MKFDVRILGQDCRNNRARDRVGRRTISQERATLWCQLEDTFQLIVTPQGMELVMVHLEVISQCLKKYRVEYKACYIFLLDTIQL